MDLHPLFYGIYERHIYHHGAGFRPPVARVDDGGVPLNKNEDYVFVRTQARLKSVIYLRPRHVLTLFRAARQTFGSRDLKDHINSMQEQADSVYSYICSDPSFHLAFEDEAGDAQRLHEEAGGADPHRPVDMPGQRPGGPQ
jgi:hypothetical protein